MDDCVLNAEIDIFEKLPLTKPEKCQFHYKCNPDETSKTCANVARIKSGLIENTVKKCGEGEKCIMDLAVGTCTLDTEKMLPGLYCEEGSQCI